jgi:heme/copper-type cytochrome/quinol oxidase subunit 4
VSESNEKPRQHGGVSHAALPRSVHIAVPLASFLILLAFAVVTLLPSNRATFPTQSTLAFVPIYLLVVVTVLLGSLYLFKNIVDKEVPSSEH